MLSVVRGKKFQKICLGLLLIFLPSQLGLHFWPSWAIVDGVRVDYLSPTIYLTDVLVFFLFASEVVEKLRASGWLTFWQARWSGRSGLIVGVVGIFCLVNLFTSLSPAVTLFKLIKISEMVYLGWWVYRNAELLFEADTLRLFLGVGVIYSSVLTIWQFLIQGSAGGWWYLIGERSFSIATPGIARAFISGQLLLRPYGEFSHPNVLAGCLGLMLIFIGACFMRIKSGKFHKSKFFWAILSLVLILGQTALFVSLSRTAIVGYLISLLILLFWRVKSRLWGVILVIFLGIGWLALGERFLALGIETEPYLARIRFFEVTATSFWHSPLFGNGLGTSSLLAKATETSFALRYQPPHSIFLVILTEIGLLGILICGYFFRWALFAVRRHHMGRSPLFLATLAFVVITGLTDHYWITLQQGAICLVVVVGMVLSSKRS